ncbi:glycosyltransferase family 2 protein [Nesterenkonia ebinurensis]|uniref:glycosyltransferase family 2 protein n=1 Tax=Nesterenkonia ebinurensis TaxID=2608252 RepID=UPI00123D8C80|nr:glycosyltransferase family A protein [Nesterenkonia ebinurensis]
MTPPGPTVSVVIPTHRRPSLLRSAIDSVLNQSSRPQEILVVSDCVDPEAAQLCEEINSSSHVRLEFIEVPDIGRGPSSTRNFGAEQSKGTLLAFLDDDDWWGPKYLEDALALIETAGVDIVVTWLTLELNSTPLPGPAIKEGLTPRDVIVRNYGTTGSNLVVLRSAFHNVGGYDTSLQNKEDTDLFYRLLKSGARYGVVQSGQAFQRHHGEVRLTDDSPDRIADQWRYLAKHRSNMRYRDLRHVLRVIHYMEAHLATTTRKKLWHRVAQLWYSSPQQFAESLSRLRP